MYEHLESKLQSQNINGVATSIHTAQPCSFLGRMLSGVLHLDQVCELKVTAAVQQPLTLLVGGMGMDMSSSKGALPAFMAMWRASRCCSIRLPIHWATPRAASLSLASCIHHATCAHAFSVHACMPGSASSHASLGNMHMTASMRQSQVVNRHVSRCCILMHEAC